MHYTGEIISLCVAAMWTVTAMVSEVGTRRIGVINFNTWRLLLATLCSLVLVYCMTGQWGVPYAGWKAWGWMALSGFVGYFFGDFCLFNSYLYISSRYGQLFMTLAPATAAVAAWFTLGQRLSTGNVVAMCVTLLGIGISVLGKEDGSRKVKVNLPWKGILFGIGAAIGQGLGLVLSKIGMNEYAADIPPQAADAMQRALPFSANTVRCIVGFGCFFVTMVGGGRTRKWSHALSDATTRRALLAAVVFGPFLGVGFSLMAVQLTKVGIAQTLMALTPILIILPSWWWFHQPITAKGVLGAVISVLGASLFFLL